MYQYIHVQYPAECEEEKDVISFSRFCAETKYVIVYFSFPGDFVFFHLGVSVGGTLKGTNSTISEYWTVPKVQQERW